MFTPPPSPTPPRTHRGRGETQHPHLNHDRKEPCLTVAPTVSPFPARQSLNRPPPPSPLLSPSAHESQVVTSSNAHVHAPTTDDHQLRALMKKRRNARRLKFSIVFVPIALMIITLSTRYMAHPALLDLLSGDSDSQGWRELSLSLLDWKETMHGQHSKRGLELAERGTSTSTGAISFPAQPSSTAVPSARSVLTDSATISLAAPTAATSTSGSAGIPTIPAAPPVLPTPFPQPLDSTGVTTYFSTDGCRTFFINMTQAAAFNECRPFSMLIGSSSAFIEAQSNLTALNTIIWGTCNTDLDGQQCEANMAWFAGELQTACATDLKANNEVATNSLLGLQVYAIMRETACLSSPVDTYCYLSALTTVADAYYYTLPLGIAMANGSMPSCSACTQDVMAEYVQKGLNTSGLQDTYEDAAVLTNGVCGAGFVQELAGSSDSAGHVVGSALRVAVSLLITVAGVTW